MSNPTTIAVALEALAAETEPPLHALTLAIPAGQIVAVLGPRGAGKKALYRVLSGAAQPVSGRIMLNGFDLARERDAAMQQITALSGTHLHSAAAVCEQFKRESGSAHVERILTHLGMRSCHSIQSAHMVPALQWPLLVAQAMEAKPSIVLLDTLDKIDTLDESRVAFAMPRLASLIRASGKTVIIMTAHLDRALAWCDHIILMRHGTLLASLPAVELAQIVAQSWYTIRVQGHLPSDWSNWFDGFVVTTELDGTTVLRGMVLDQAELYGLLGKIRDLGLPLLAVQRETVSLDTICAYLGLQAETKTA